MAYSGHYGMPRYSCNVGNSMHGLAPCISFGATRPDLVVARLLLDVVQPMAIEAAMVAEEQASHRDDERKRASSNARAEPRGSEPHPAPADSFHAALGDLIARSVPQSADFLALVLVPSWFLGSPTIR